MDYTELGETGLAVSALSLGAGGGSKLGLNSGRSETEAIAVVERAIEHGITTFDTAPVYDTEPIIGAAIADRPRDEFVVSTKFSLYEDGDLRPANELGPSLDASCERLGTDVIDIYHLHGVNPGDYEEAADRYLSGLHDLKDDGRIRAVGITETTGADPGHEVLSKAVEDPWDVMMVGFNLLNHSARDRVFDPAASRGIGIMGMIPVRRALNDPALLAETVADLIESDEIDPTLVDPADPFDVLFENGHVDSVYEAAYRFAYHEPAIDTLLTGTGNPDHLDANVAAVATGPLPEEAIRTIEERFGDVVSKNGNA